MGNARFALVARSHLTVIALALAAVTPVHASLIGDTVTFVNQAGPTTVATGSATVGSLEYSQSIGSTANGINYNIDVEANTIRFSLTKDGALNPLITSIGFGDPQSFDVNSLDIAGDIVGVSVVNNGVSGLAASPVSFTADSISLNVGLTTWDINGDWLLVKLITDAPVPAPSLIGDTVTFANKLHDTTFASGSAIVSPLEYSQSIGSTANGINYNIDVEANTIRFSLTKDGALDPLITSIGFGDPQSFDVNSLDIAGDIVGVSVVNNGVSGLAASPVSFTADSISLNVGLTTWDINRDTLVVQLITRASVPEPGALALLGIGLAGLAAARRRKH